MKDNVDLTSNRDFRIKAVDSQNGNVFLGFMTNTEIIKIFSFTKNFVFFHFIYFPFLVTPIEMYFYQQFYDVILPY